MSMKEDEPKYSDDELRVMEDELKDSTGWLGYVAPRPLRKAAWGVLGANSLWGALILLGKYGTIVAGEDLDKITGNLATAAVFGVLLAWEFADQGTRKARRTNLRKRQIELGDREVYTRVDEKTGQTRKFSKLKGVDDEWILRRIDRWGVVETAQTRGNPLPTIGPAKGAVVENLVEELKPKFILDIGTFVGYAAIRMGRKQPPGGLTVTVEKNLRWNLAARRFVWQSKLWQQYPWEEPPSRRVQCVLGDAADPATLTPIFQEHGPADLVFIDGAMREYLSYLEACETVGLVQPGRTTVVADNAEVFKELDGVKQYLEYVRTSGKYDSRTIESTLEYRDDTPDALEVSRALPVQREGAGEGASDSLQSVES